MLWQFNELVQKNGKLSKAKSSTFLATGPCFCFFLLHICMYVNDWTVLCLCECYHLTSSLSCMCISMCVFLPVCAVMTRRSDRCCKHKPASLEDRPATQAEKHALCTQDKPLHHFTSATVGSADCPLPRWGFWPRLSNHLGIHQSLL